ncbi:MAG: RNA polymerase sigma factor [Bryobacteraceae bacterium]
MKTTEIPIAVNRSIHATSGDAESGAGVRSSEPADEFLSAPSEASFTALFRAYSPQLVAFFRRRGHDLALAEDLAQEVMITVFHKASQLRDRRLFRAWLFQIARRAVCRHFAKRTRDVPTVILTDGGDSFAATSGWAPGGSAFEFGEWMRLLDPPERDVMTMRFVEQWEYHEIAAAQEIPIGTLQWRVFNAKKKLALRLSERQQFTPRAA